ncbi:MAG TPA: VOC family protein [Chitinophagales bacterium]|nr:VOC family protein [Chitinophagales bacterium]HMZ90562.1 VOC family protein [Chitinophagales bacterium]HNE44818.1 VOC family protein [Chitinophagales bacterium]HNF70367.1 VOC family protein [Chitinophagales bacterium]HNI53056.1 VOC family protein [Chitinophagales bacterium]
MKRVTGIGGIFFRAKGEVKELNSWYEKHLGFDYINSNGYPFWAWRSMEDPEKIGASIWSIFPRDTKYFGSNDQQFMFNFRVENMVELIETLRSEGVEIAGEIQEFEYGKFCWIIDPDGNKIELWEAPENPGFEGGMPAK